ncbi:hypothetical protein ABPG74_007866 [Tetrahymena malaccensis]
MRFFNIILTFIILQANCFDQQENQLEIEDQNCDINIIQQLELQKVSYSCEGSEILVQNQNQINLDLQFINLKFSSSPLIIQNINIANINNLTFQNIQIRQINYLVQFNNIDNLTIQNLNIFNAQPYNYIIGSSNINQLTIGQILLQDLLNYNTVFFDSENLSINKISFINSVVCQFYLRGKQNLQINNIQMLFDQKYYDYLICSPEINYSSNKQIVVQNIFIEVTALSESKTSVWNIFANFYIFNSFLDTGLIDIGIISYKSSFTNSQLYGIIKIGRNSTQTTEVTIKKFILNQNQSNSSIQLQIFEIQQILINQIVVEGFFNSVESESQVNVYIDCSSSECLKF